MTDGLVTDLGKIGALRVISRTSIMRYKGFHKPMAEIVRELNVRAGLRQPAAGDRPGQDQAQALRPPNATA